VATLAKDISPTWLNDPITIPANTTSGQYYIQLKVTSGNEKSEIIGPYDIDTSISSSASSNPAGVSSASTSTANTNINTAGTSHNSSSSSFNLPPEAIAGIFRKYLLAGKLFSVITFAFDVLCITLLTSWPVVYNNRHGSALAQENEVNESDDS
jgi:hypothetical protein